MPIKAIAPRWRPTGRILPARIRGTFAHVTLFGLTNEERGFVPIVALVEFGCVLESRYERNRNQIAEGYEAILRSRELVVENAEAACSRAVMPTPAKPKSINAQTDGSGTIKPGLNTM